MSLQDELIKIAVDKFVIAIILVIVGYFINKKFEIFKNEQQRIKDLQKQKDDLELKIKMDKRDRELEFIERQIKEFFWPVYLRLEKDNVLWVKVGTLKKSAQTLPKEADEVFEKEFILKNHDEVVKILEDKTFLIDNDKELLTEILAYIRHVAVYKTIRGIETLKSINPIALDEPYPKKLFPLIEDRLQKLQGIYSQNLSFFKEELPHKI